MIGLTGVAQENSRWQTRRASARASLEQRVHTRGPVTDPTVRGAATRGHTQPAVAPHTTTPAITQQSLQSYDATLPASAHIIRAVPLHLPLHRRIQLATPRYVVVAVILATLLPAVGWGGWSLTHSAAEARTPSTQHTATSDPQQPASNNAAPAVAGATADPQGTFARLEIPSLNIKAPVEPVGKTSDGSMDVPSSAWALGWYKYGAHIGERGNAVVAGHLGAPGQDAIFKHLDKVQVGDLIVVTQQNGVVQQFKVTKTQTVTDANAPLNTIFGASTGTHLNLITCKGTWRNQDYSNRFIVYSDLVPAS